MASRPRQRKPKELILKCGRCNGRLVPTFRQDGTSVARVTCARCNNVIEFTHRSRRPKQKPQPDDAA